MRLRVKDFTTKVGSGVTPRGGAESYQESGIPLFRSQNVVDNGFLMDDIAYISEEIDESMKGSRVKSGDVLLNITGASIGRCYYTSHDFKRGNVNQHVCIIRPMRNVVSPEFLHYNLISQVGKEYIRLSQTGANREGLTIEDIKNFSFEIPSLEEQKLIVDYLDAKTASIDNRATLLEKKRDAYTRLRASVINHVVTRGLDPYVTLAESGVEWIGVIPKHWDVKRLKDITILSPNVEVIDPQQMVSFLPMEGLRMGKTNTTTVVCKDVYKKYTPFGNGDLLIAKVTPCFENGNIAVAENLENGIGYGTSEIFVLRAKKNTDIRFMFYLSLSKAFQDKACATMCGVGGLKRISPLFMKAHKVGVPPLQEQQTIANYLDIKCAEIDDAMRNIDKQLDALKRLKRSLINEVISGKRKV